MGTREKGRRGNKRQKGTSPPGQRNKNLRDFLGQKKTYLGDEGTIKTDGKRFIAVAFCGAKRSDCFANRGA